jgi:sugar transferase (PEP-CTERM/EpsH1 system associated)
VKILVLSHRIPFPPNKGEKIRTYHQIQFLASRGHEIVVLSPYEGEAESGFARELERELSIEVMMFPLRAKWLRLLWGLATNRPLTVSYFYSSELQRAFDDLVASSKCDAVLCTSSAMASYVFRSEGLAKERGLPGTRLIMDFMDLDSDKWNQYQANSALPMSLVYSREARLVSRLETDSYQAFDACFFVSANESLLFAEQLPESSKVRVMGNGIDTDVFFPDPIRQVSGHPVFLFTGVMNYRPNEDAVEWFVDAVWPSILSAWPEAEFIVAGMDPSPKIQQLGKIKGITITGFVQDIVPFYQKATVFVAPFRLARGLQNKILQSLACGLPVVTTSLGLEGINAKDGIDLLVADGEQEFITKIERLMTEPSLYRRLSENGPRLIQREHSWSSILRDLADAVEVRDIK